MIIDKETKIFLEQRVKNNSKLHHLLEPKELREERLRQLKDCLLYTSPSPRD